MRMEIPITGLFFSLGLLQNVHGQTHGESIFGKASTNTNSSVLTVPGNAFQNPAHGSLANLTNGAPVGFDRLAGYSLALPRELVSNTNRPAWADTQINAMIPQDIRALEGRDVSVEGFMIPTVYEKDKVTEFLLARDPMGCCYSSVPQIDQLVKVRVKEPGVKEMIYNTVRARGILHVSAERENGELTSIYRMDGLSVEKGPEE